MSEHMTQAEVRELVSRLLKENDLTGWRVAFSSARARAGSCSYGTKTLRFSTVYMNACTREGTVDTVLHEVAHAIAGHNAGHGPEWKLICRQLGGSGNRCWDTTALVKPESVYRWAYTCASCHEVLGQTTGKRNYSRSVTRCCSAKVIVHPINQPISRRELAG